MNKMPRSIGEICNYIRGVSFNGEEARSSKSEGHLPILRAGNIGDYLDTQNDLIWVPKKRVAKEQHLQKNDIVICMASGSPQVVGKTAQLHQDFQGSVGAFCGIVRVKNADPLYVNYWFNSFSFFEWRNRKARGANIQNLRPTEILEITIPLPPLSEQKRIAAILQKADRIRRQRRYARQLSDGYLQSVFLEMFGDPVGNSKKWEVKAIKELGRVVTGSTPPTVLEGMFGGSIPFITPGDLTVNTLSPNRYLTESGARKSETVRGGSTLVCCIGTIGKMDMAIIESAFNQQINAIEWSETINDDFGFHTLSFFSKLIFDKGSSTTLPILRKSEFEKIEIPIPPIEDQIIFSKIASQFERHRNLGRESERQAELLFQSLLHQAFEES